MKVYVASSWRNPRQPEVVEELRAAGHQVYDFRNPTKGNKGFHWSEIDPDWQSWTPEKYRDALKHPLAVIGFSLDMLALKWSEACLYLLPCGRSASLEAGWAAGSGRVTLALLADGEPELMVNMFDYICLSMEEVLKQLESLRVPK